jgi:hypothetical protein
VVGQSRQDFNQMRPYEEVTVEVGATAERVWQLIADVTNMGRWSPVCYKCEWLGGETGPRLGARFMGYNKQGPFRWSRECEVTVCDPGRAFGFSTFFRGKESTRWLYRFEPSSVGTKIVEAYEPVSEPLWITFISKVPGARARLDRDHRKGMKETLARVKGAAERYS